MVVCAIGLMLWTIYLGWRLPRVYVTEHWKLAWVGLDTFELISLALTTWAAYRRRVLVIAFATATATAFLLDAWFDVTTARSGDFRESLITAIAVEIPAAIVMYGVSIIALRRLVRRWQNLEVHPASRLRDAEVPGPTG
jgi:hypothetical protein